MSETEENFTGGSQHWQLSDHASDRDELDLIDLNDSEDETILNQALATSMAVIHTSIENMKRARSPDDNEELESESTQLEKASATKARRAEQQRIRRAAKKTAKQSSLSSSKSKAQNLHPSTPSESPASSPAPLPRTKRSKVTTARKSTPEPIQITAYIKVEKPAVAVRGKKKPSPVVINKGPFFFNLSSSFTEFLALAAAALPTRPKLLVLPKLEWKYEKPANDARKPLANDAGYLAMKTSLTSKAKPSDLVVLLFMPPPVESDETWDTGEDDHVAKPFDFYQEAPDLAVDIGVKTQIASLQGERLPWAEKLDSKYPIGNDRRWPEMRVYQDKSGRCWQLNPLRLQVWSLALASNKPGVSLESPPSSGHFADNQKLKNPTAILSAQAPATLSTQPMYYQNQQQYQHPLHYSSPPGYQYTPLPQPPQYQQIPYQPAELEPSAPNGIDAPTAAPAAYAIPAPFLSPRRIRRLKIKLEDFCDRYEISESDCRKLQDLEYVPGRSKVEKLPVEEWKGVGFTRLGWEGFLEAHTECLGDITQGRWDIGGEIATQVTQLT